MQYYSFSVHNGRPSLNLEFDFFNVKNIRVGETLSFMGIYYKEVQSHTWVGNVMNRN